MKKTIFLTLALVLAFVGTTRGQSTSDPFKVTSVSFAYTSNPFVYDGTEKTYITSFEDNCSLNDGSLTGNTATNAGSYTATISSQCYGHPIGDPMEYEEFHVGSESYNWTILPRSISKTDYTDYNVSITVHNQKWTGSEIELAADVSDTDTKVYSIKFKDAELKKGTDYDVYTTIESSTGKIKDAGRYTIVFVGKGNFTGTVTKTFDVKKDLTTAATEAILTYDIPTQIMLYQNNVTDVADIANATYTLNKLNIQVKDANSHELLYEGEDYTLEYYSEYTDETTNTPIVADHPEQLTLTQTGNPTSTETGNLEKKYIVKITGTGTKYTGSKILNFYTLAEYQKTVANASDIDPNKILWYRISTTNPGYPTNALPGAAMNYLSTAKGQVTVGAPIGTAINKETNKLTIPAGNATLVGDKTIEFDVVGIEKYAFAGCNVLRWMDIQIPAATWTPSSLDRNVPDSPFFGLPKPTLVYLFGNNVVGVNYVYKFGGDDLRCAQYHIYEDQSGQQIQYSK